LQERVNSEVANKVIKLHGTTLKSMLAKNETLVREHVPGIMEAASNSAAREYQQEIDRLLALRTVNPNIRQEEIDYFNQEAEQIQRQLSATVAQLDAIKVIIAV